MIWIYKNIYWEKNLKRSNILVSFSVIYKKYLGQVGYCTQDTRHKKNKVCIIFLTKISVMYTSIILEENKVLPII